MKNKCKRKENQLKNKRGRENTDTNGLKERMNERKRIEDDTSIVSGSTQGEARKKRNCADL